jgi:hypothetical protein
MSRLFEPAERLIATDPEPLWTGLVGRAMPHPERTIASVATAASPTMRFLERVNGLCMVDFSRSRDS